MTGTHARECPTGQPERAQEGENASGVVQTYPEPEIALCGRSAAIAAHVASLPQFIDPARIMAALNGCSAAVLLQIATLPVPSRGRRV